jgi:hypothetical protein
VLETWGRGVPSKGTRVPFEASRSSVRSVLRALADRWPTPVEATIGVRGRMHGAPRWPYQLADAVRRTAGFLFTQSWPRQRRN